MLIETNKTQFDTMVRGGLVLDGSGSEARYVDIGIVDDRIAAVGSLNGASAGREIDATGLHVTPGFIDIHTHSDLSALYAPDQASAIAMGVTTQIVGNCGLFLGLATRADVFEFEKRWLAPHQVRITWNTCEEFLRRVQDNGIATNFVPLAGHGSLRKRIVGLEDRPVTAEERTGMQRELETAMVAGIWGLSTGLEYPPSSYADEDELTELCRVVAAHGGLYATHLRNEGDTLIEAVQEALNISERAGLPLQLSHHKAEGRPNWGKIKTTLKMVEEARSRGLDVQLDQYPYTAFMTGLSIQVLPRWALAGSQEEMIARLRDPTQRAAILADMRAAHPDWEEMSAHSPWKNMQIGVCRGRPDIQGVSLHRLIQESGQPPLEAVLTLLVEAGGYVSAVNFAIDEEDIAEVMRCPWTSIGSDGVATQPGGKSSEDHIHPRAYGTFPRVLGRYVREQSVLSESAAIHKMTGLPAARLGLTDRGQIAPGFFADLTLYNPATVGDLATFAAPHQFAQGIEWVLVNGRIACQQGHPNSARAGRVLRKNA